jgi:hypothetical protein
MDSSCSAQSTIIGYVDGESFDYIYVSSDSNETVSLLFDGYYIITVPDGGLYFLTEFINSQFVGYVDCVPSSTPTPTPTQSVTPTPTSTPPEMATLTIIVPPGTPSIIFDGDTYTSNVTAGVVKNQQYSINSSDGTSNFWYWSGTGINLPAANSQNTIVFVTGNTATLEVNYLNQPTRTPTPTQTLTPTPTTSQLPLDFTLTSECNPIGINLTNFSGGSGQWEYSAGVFTTENDALNSGLWFTVANYWNNVGTDVNSDGTYWAAVRDANNQTNKVAKSVIVSCSTPTSTPTPTPTQTPTQSVTPTQTPTQTVTPTQTLTPSPTPSSAPTGSIDIQYEFNSYNGVSGYMQILSHGSEVVNTLSGSLDSGTFYTVSGMCTGSLTQELNVFNTSNNPSSSIVMGYTFHNQAGITNRSYNVVNYSVATGSSWDLCADGIMVSDDLTLFGYTTTTIPIYSFNVSNGSSASSNMLCSGSILNTIQSTGSTLDIGSEIAVNLSDALTTGGISTLPGFSWGPINYISDGTYIYGFTANGQVATITSKTPCS